MAGHQCSKGWEARCANAKGARCTCQCGGHNHGKDRARQDDPAQDAPLPGFRYQYQGYSGCQSECQIEILRRDGQPPIVIATELPDNQGTSITNMAEQLAAEINVRYLGGRVGEPAAPMVWIEHYLCRCPYAKRGLHELFTCESYSVVTFGSSVINEVWQHGRMSVTLGTPNWQHLEREAADAMRKGKVA